MKTAIDHTCGHRTEANLTGTNTHGERDRKATHLATRPCPDCARADRETGRQEQNQQAAADASANGWPALTGTDRQIAWATTLRAETIQAMADRLARHHDTDAADQALHAWTGEALRHTEAAWWIDNRALGIRAVNNDLTPEGRAALQALTAGK